MLDRGGIVDDRIVRTALRPEVKSSVQRLKWLGWRKEERNVKTGSFDKWKTGILSEIRWLEGEV